MSVDMSDALAGIQTQAVGELPQAAGQPPVDGPADASQSAETTAGDAQQTAPAQTPADQTQTETVDKRSPSFRFSELTAARNKAQEEAAYWRGVAEAMRQGQAPAPAQNAPTAPEPAAPPAAPDPSKYEYGEVDPRYLRDMSMHAAREATAEVFRSQAEAREAEERAKVQKAQFETGFERFKSVVQETQAAGFEAGAEVLRVVARDTQTADLLATSTYPAHLAEWLGRNPQYLNDVISTPNPIERARLIERADVHVSTYVDARRAAANRPTPPAAPAAPAPQPSAAPTPAAPAGLTATTGIQGRGGAVPFNPDSASIGDLEARFRALHSRSR